MKNTGYWKKILLITASSMLLVGCEGRKKRNIETAPIEAKKVDDSGSQGVGPQSGAPVIDPIVNPTIPNATILGDGHDSNTGVPPGQQTDDDAGVGTDTAIDVPSTDIPITLDDGSATVVPWDGTKFQGNSSWSVKPLP